MPIVGLQFDLSAWKKGIRSAGALVRKGISSTLLTPFDRAVKKSTAAMRAGFAKAGAFIKGALSSALAPLAGLLAVGAILTGIRKAISGSIAAYRDYSDSVTVLRAALETLNGANVDAIQARVTELGNQLRLSMGIASDATNRAFATFVTRGFDEGQARQLTILAANYAKKAGKPIGDVTKQIADAATGSVDAMKELGLQIAATGKPADDARAAVLALKAAYGDIGGELANPSERLAAAWGQLAVSLGEKISPIIEPLVQGFADFVAGLTETEQGEQALQKVADAIGFVVKIAGEAVARLTGYWQLMYKGVQTLYHLIVSGFATALATIVKLANKNPVVSWLLGKAGIDVEGAVADIERFAEESAAKASEAFDGAKAGFDSLVFGKESEGNFRDWVADIRDAGKAAREEAAAALAQEMAATREQGFAGRTAEERQAAMEAQAQQRQGAMEKQAQRLQGYGQPGAGTAVSVRIVNTRPDRWRRARAR